jgi:tetratricopeptide (TPR) repeat protein
MSLLLAISLVGAPPPAVKASTRERSVPEVQADQRTKVEITGPQLKMTDVVLETAGKMDDVRKRQLALIEQLLELEVDDNRYAKLLFRKAELLHERARFYTFAVGGAEDEAAQLRAAGKESEALAVETKIGDFRKEAKRSQRAAINVFHRILSELPNYERMPEVLHALGQAWWEVGFKEAALDTYTRIIREFPDSNFVPDAWLSFGEYYFQNQELVKALQAYEKAASFEGSLVRGFAEYKMAWTLYNLNDFSAAMDHFKTVVVMSAAKGSDGRKRFDLGREARRDWVSAYSHIGKGAEALAAIRAVAPAHERIMANRLADIWLGDGKDRHATFLLDALIEQGEGDPLLPSYYAKQLRALVRVSSRETVVAAVRGVAQRLKLPPDDPAQQRLWVRSMAEVDLGIRRVATLWHSDGMRVKSNELLNDAAKVYSVYLELFPSGPNTHEMTFYSGELAYGLGRFEEAAEAYRKAVEMDRKGRYAGPAALEMVRAYDQLVEAERAKGGQADPATLKRRSGRMIAACKLYLEVAPGGELAAIARYRIAQAHYDRDEFDQALAAFEAILEVAATGELGEVTADQILDVYQAQRDWRGLLKRARQFAEDPRFADRPAFGVRALMIVDQTNFKVLSLEMADLPPDAVAQGFVRYASSSPKSAYADEALFNAAVYWEKAGRHDKALAVRLTLVKAYPRSEQVGRTYFNLANAGRKTCDFAAAAERLERFASTNPDDDLALPAWLDASVYREDLGDDGRALLARRRYIQLALKLGDPKQKKTLDRVRLSLGNLIERAQGASKAARYYDDLAAELTDPALALVAFGRAAEAWRRVRQRRSRWAIDGLKRAEAALALAAADAEGGGLALKGEGARLVAAGRFVALQQAFDAFAAHKLPSVRAAAAFRAGFEAHVEELTALKLRFVELAKLGSAEYAVASLERIGSLFDVMAKKVLGVPAPAGLSMAAADVFRDQLTERAMPFQTQASEVFEECVARARQWGVSSDAARRCLEFMVENVSDRYPRLDEEIPDFGGDRLAVLSALGQLSVRATDLDRLEIQTGQKSASAQTEEPTEAETVAAPAAADSAEEKMRKAIRSDGTVESGSANDGLLFEEEE